MIRGSLSRGMLLLVPMGVMAASLVVLAAPGNASSAEPVGRQRFTDPRDPPSFAPLSAEVRADRDLGHAVFNTSWVEAATPGAARRDGLGPIYIAASCDACHNEGARARGPTGDGTLPVGFVLGFGGQGEGGGDPHYGHVLGTVALPAMVAEGQVQVRYTTRNGIYPDGTPYSLRVPNYVLRELTAGPLAADSVLRPRMAPALFGVGLLAAVPDAALLEISRAQPRRQRGTPLWHVVGGRRQLGRFDWQNDAVSVADQTARAFAREMGLTNPLMPHDDCMPSQHACRSAANGGTPEVSRDLFAALLAFQNSLAVPQSPSPLPAAEERAGEALFTSTGCASCHRPSLPVNMAGGSASIAPYTDLLTHDLGAELADRRADGHVVASRWRTAPLWGLHHALTRPNGSAGLLHDGRARNVEEAILWHDGQARETRVRFEHLTAARRAQLLRWVEAH